MKKAIDLSEYLVGKGEQFRFQLGDVLWSQGEEADSLLVVSTGVLKLQRRWPSGGQTILSLLSRGSIAGEEAVQTPPIRSTSCVAIVQGKGFRISKKKLVQALEQPAVALSLVQLASKRQSQTLMRMEELLDGPVETRLANTLIRLGRQMGISDGRGQFIPVRLTRGELAEFIGCRAETTTRLMTKWKREGIVDTKREGIVIQNQPKLQTIATG
jgi:CRP-like cAMP-binding protein